MDRRNFIKLMGLGTGALAMGCGGGRGIAEAGRRPNVILLITDDQGYGDLGCHGNEVIQTPNMDALYGQSTRLTNFHVGPTCSPTRSSLMTGRYCNRVGVWHTIMGRSQLRSDETTMGDVFRSNGYATGMFGKWHLGDNYPFSPRFRGFEKVVCHGGGGVGNTQDAWGNDYFDDKYCHNGVWKQHEGYCTDVWFEEARAFIREKAESGRPFLCYLATNAPHGPFLVPEKYSDLYKKEFPDWPWAVPPNFYGMITCIDENLGRLMGDLEQLGVSEDTILIFMTDNGTSGQAEVEGIYNAGMRAYKGSPYDGGHRVPFFIRWPGRIPAGQDVSRLTAHIDVLPTLAALCGLRPPEHLPWDGMDITPLLQESGGEWAERTIITDSQRVEDPVKWRHCSVMTDRWRLINGEELYDMSGDPGQQTDVAADHPDVVAKLRADYEEWWRDTSRRFGEYTRTVLGSDKENPVLLTSHDWHGPASQRAWNQRRIKLGPEGNGFWAVEVERAGEYEITLRRWPREHEAPLRESFIDVTRATLEMGDIRETAEVSPADNQAVFRVKLPAGPMKLLAGFEDAGGEKRGAYFTYVERLTN